MRTLTATKAGITLVIALVIAFTRPDRISYGLALFAAYALTSAVVSAVVVFVTRKSLKDEGYSLTLLLLANLVSLATGLFAVSALGQTVAAQANVFAIASAANFTALGAVETWLGFFAKPPIADAREHKIGAVLAFALVAVITILGLPPVHLFGLFGAYLAITTVQQGIWATSPKKSA